MSARPVTPVLPARLPARAGAAARWADIVTPAGRYDRRVIARIAHATARAERNLEILVAAGIATPRALPLADTRLAGGGGRADRCRGPQPPALPHALCPRARRRVGLCPREARQPACGRQTKQTN